MSKKILPIISYASSMNEVERENGKLRRFKSGWMHAGMSDNGKVGATGKKPGWPMRGNGLDYVKLYLVTRGTLVPGSKGSSSFSVSRRCARSTRF